MQALLNSEELTRFLEVVESDVLPSQELKRYFQKHPFSPTLNEGEVPLADGAFTKNLLQQVVFPLIEKGGTIDHNAMQRIRQDIILIWVNGLGSKIQKAHCQWRDSYMECIRQIIDRHFFHADGRPKLSHRMTRTILEITNIDNPCRWQSFDTLKGVFFDLVVSPERASLLSKDQEEISLLNGRSVRDFFTHKEEAMILMVIRKHFVQRLQGSRVLVGYWPLRTRDGVTDEESMEIPPTYHHNDVLGDNVLHREDARYYRTLSKMFKKQDEIAGDSFMARKHHSLSLPGRYTKRTRLSKDYHQCSHHRG
ncbi:expressed unknown protein [Seminavis robusta]|uniref:Uncharacterized protein n=1 Tax=Seminavis robusta TaxID=568900 RepID=A0A9N8EY02_9STRA|nr:expressed unknown protein [Seminavis robusta]|eukprot:Sro2129_g315770.1 n/a (309) ;mRNA; r:3143-4292